MTTSNLVVPMVLWGQNAPTHCVASIMMSPDQQHVITGCNDGQICVWEVKENWTVEPYRMLFGHSAAVTCLCIGSNHPEKNYIISSSDNGEMCLWDLKDGRCIEHTKFPYTHTGVQAYQLIHASDVRLICSGYYPEIHVMHPLSLEILFSLHSRIQPDWISALCILRPVKREDDVVLAITNSGTVKVWTMTGNEGKSSQPIYEDEAKQIRCLNAHTLKCCAYNQRTVLIVCPKYWQIYDAGDFSLLCSESARRGERWMGGEFIALDRVAVWSSDGRGYLYKLPTNVNPNSPEYRRSSNPSNPRQEGPQAYHVLGIYLEKPLSCCPAMIYVLGRRERECKLLMRGDSEGRLAIWIIPDVHDKKMKLVRQESFEKLPVIQPTMVTTMTEAWQSVRPIPEGLIDHLNQLDGKMLQITATIYIPTQGRSVCGREDGSIVIVPAVQAMTLLLLSTLKTKESLPRQVLQGHSGRVNCLLYPVNDSPRYDPDHLVSGGMDFTVVLWDISNGTKLHTFSVHGGEIMQLIVPPENCNPRVLPCVCSVASDHSLALLSLKERKSILLAARQLFPIHTVKWRPLDDFLVIGCTDGTVYVWQMETGHLDRVVHGVTAEDILQACDQKQIVTTDVTNPHISLAQALKRRNLATFRNMAQQKIQQVQDAQHKHDHGHPHMHLLHRPDAYPMLIQGLRANTKDADAHVVFFDIESLIIQLLGEEYALMSPGTLEAHGLSSNRDTSDHASDPHRKIAGFIAKVKDKAENVGHKIQAKAESAGFVPISPMHQRRGEDGKRDKSSKPKNINIPEGSLTMEIARFFMSMLHAWGQDSDLDKLALNKLGLLKPTQPLTFGILSRGGHMSLLLPGWNTRYLQRVTRGLAEMLTEAHWQISTALTTQHLVSVISVSNTLMSMSNSSFTVEADALHKESETAPANGSDMLQQSQTKQGWSLLATLHCVLLPDLLGKERYHPPQLEMLARRWQDRCLEIREAAQALFLAELRRIGPEGRKCVVDDWSPYLPSYVDPAMSLLAEHQQTQGSHSDHQDDDIDEEDQILGGDTSDYRLSTTFESRRKQATAIVMMGVLGAEFGQEMEPSKRKDKEDKRKQQAVKGFSSTDYSHARHTSKALTFLLLQPPSQRLPAFSPLRRAAIDLLGRGFTIWEPYLDVSAVLLGLLELCVDGDKLVPSLTFGLPLTPQADACRTARHALGLIATARPPAFIITMAKEVARYNAMAQNAQTPHNQLCNSVLVRAKSEILRILELLVEKIPNDVVDFLVEVMDVTVHCIDSAQIKARGLQDVFPSICRFSMVSYCNSTRRICVGAKNGGVAFYELKQAKCQVLPAHKGAVTAVAFSPDGKFLASYGINDNKLSFWQTASTSLFGIGSQQTKCVKTYATPPVNIAPNTNPLKLARLIWVDPRTVVLLTVDGTETKFRV